MLVSIHWLCYWLKGLLLIRMLLVCVYVISKPNLEMKALNMCCQRLDCKIMVSLVLTPRPYAKRKTANCKHNRTVHGAGRWLLCFAAQHVEQFETWRFSPLIPTEWMLEFAKWRLKCLASKGCGSRGWSITDQLSNWLPALLTETHP